MVERNFKQRRTFEESQGRTSFEQVLNDVHYSFNFDIGGCEITFYLVWNVAVNNLVDYFVRLDKEGDMSRLVNVVEEVPVQPN